MIALQYYLSGLFGFLIIEMLANWGKSLCLAIHSQVVHINFHSILPVSECSWRGHYINCVLDSRLVSFNPLHYTGRLSKFTINLCSGHL